MPKAIKPEGFQLRPLLDFGSIDGYWQARAEALSTANRAKAFQAPTWENVFAPPEVAPAPDIEAMPAWVTELLPRHDPLRAEARRKRLNHEQ